MPRGVPMRRFFGELYSEISDDNVFNGAAALAYYLILSLFPAAIVLLSLIGLVPVPDLRTALFDFLGQALPGNAASLLQNILGGVMRNASGGLLSFGILFAIWSASSGLAAIMQQLNITYDVKESRPYWKVRGVALLLTLLFTVLVIGAFVLIVSGGMLEDLIAERVGASPVLIGAFVVFRWIVIAALLLLGFAVIYYYGPDVEQRFRFVSAGSIIGVVLLALGSMVFQLYVDNFSSYDKTYGSLGAAIILLLWLYLAGLVILIGSEVNALLEHYSSSGKDKGERTEPRRESAAA